MRFEDLTNRTLDQLTVLKRVGSDKNGHVLWLCRCACGKEIVKPLSYFSINKKNAIYSCGCKHSNLIGKKFGSWTVLRYENKVKNNHLWLCQCDCGKKRVISEVNFKYGGSKSCGCAREQVWGLLPGDAGFNQLLLSYKKSARKRNLEFLLSDKEFKDLVTKNCHYCGSVPSSVIKNQSEYSVFKYNGIDRVDNLKGYFIGNCVPCCKKCNEMKRSFKSFEFLKQCILIDNFQKEKCD